MKTLRLDTYHDVNRWRGTFPEASWIDRVIPPDTLVLKPDGSPLLLLVRGVLTGTLYADTYQAVAPLARSSPRHNRGIAAGKIRDVEDYNLLKGGVSKGGSVGMKTATRYQPIKKNGRLSGTMYAKDTPSFVMGYSDRSARFPYCRQTAYTAKYPERTTQILPALQHMSQVFHEVLPSRYQAQADVAHRTSSDFVFAGTVFSTLTINRNWQTALHTDVGDLPEGFGVMACLRAGYYEGGIYVMPAYGVGVDMQPGDVLFSDVHEWHGNTPLLGKPPYERITIVCYFRTRMRECGTLEEELARVKRQGVRGAYGR